MGRFTAMDPEINSAEMVEREIIAMAEWMRWSAPRSNKPTSWVGPSDAGHPCTIKHIHRIANHRPPRGFIDGWYADMGRFGHAGMEAGVRAFQEKQGWDKDRYLLEHDVNVGTACGRDITGNADLFDILTGTVLDYKFVGATPLRRYRLNGPGVTYRRQAHLYGRGFQRQGYDVRQVVIAFLPRNGALGSSQYTLDPETSQVQWQDRGDRYFWSEPYDEQIAIDTLARLNGIGELVAKVGAEALLEMYEPCSEPFCPWCG